MNKLPASKRAQILSLLCEGNSMRSVSRLTDTSINTVSALLKFRNDAASPTEYVANQRDIRHALWSISAAGTEVLAVYHSHPTSAAVPSRTDLARNAWGETAASLRISCSSSSSR